jgi:hypothetical protein
VVQLHSVRRLLFHALTIVIVAGMAVAVALLVTPMQTVHAAGQTVRVGVPGELGLFGQRLPTTIEFVGPVRPRLELTESRCRNSSPT